MNKVGNFTTRNTTPTITSDNDEYADMLTEATVAGSFAVMCWSYLPNVQDTWTHTCPWTQPGVLQSVCRANMNSSDDRFHHCAVAADALSAALELAARHNKSNFCECCGKIVVFSAFVTFCVVFVFN